MKLLSARADSKTIKGEKKGYITGILYLMPDDEICRNGRNAGCIGDGNCLVNAGRAAIFSSINEARTRKTLWLKTDPKAFMAQLVKDIAALERKAMREGLTPVCRPNGTSDWDWQSMTHEGKTIFEWFPNVQFMDYTKMPKRSRFSNYHITASYSGRPAYAKTVAKALRLGMSLAVVFDGTPPITFMGRPVIDGDKDDLRFLDRPGCIVALKPKGKAAKHDQSGFVVRRPNLIAAA